MTAQISDHIHYKEQDFTLAAIDGDGFFDPGQYGMEPVAVSSACWRGFVAYYRIKDRELQLNSLNVSLTGTDTSENGQNKVIPAPALRGYSANTSPDNEFDFYEYSYSDMSLLVPFTGGLLLADDFIRELYVHMGFHPAWKYKTVHELLFEKGHLVGESNLSCKMEEIRQEMEREELRPKIGTIPNEKYLEWIAQCFSRDYGW